MTDKSNPALPSFCARRSGQLLTACASLALAACAGSSPERGPERGAPSPAGAMALPIALVFATMDVDADRLVTADELDEGLYNEWSFADADRSGTISVFEIEAWAEASLGSRNRLPNRLSFDRDLNGAITRTEFDEGMAREVAILDKNADGQLSRAELLITVRSRRDADTDSTDRPERGRGRGGGRGGF